MPRLQWLLILVAASALAQQPAPVQPETKALPQASGQPAPQPKPERPKIVIPPVPYPLPEPFPIVIAPCTTFPDNPVFVIDGGIKIIKIKDFKWHAYPASSAPALGPDPQHRQIPRPALAR
jgi:hypothetical protein